MAQLSVLCRIAPMAVTVRIPTTLRTLTGGEAKVEVEGSTVAEVLDAVDRLHPGFRERIVGEDGNLKRFVNVFVSDDDIRFMDGLETAVPEGATVSIVPAVAGG
ncbi:MAG: molybdopterin synthase sulfur carrier subunit [Acidimicrobiales bacterium]|nr:MAG: molybdopterin synthase sulfur carrier subunit [Acidimicrobiales bacterium]